MKMMTALAAWTERPRLSVVEESPFSPSLLLSDPTMTLNKIKRSYEVQARCRLLNKTKQKNTSASLLYLCNTHKESYNRTVHHYFFTTALIRLDLFRRGGALFSRIPASGAPSCIMHQVQ